MTPSYLAIFISMVALYYSYQANKNTEKGFQRTFKGILRTNIKNTKYLIMDKESMNKEIHILIENIQDNLLYQSHEEDKKSYLTREQRNYLSTLQLSIEDNVSCIKLQTDIDTNIEQARHSLNFFMDKLK